MIKTFFVVMVIMHGFIHIMGFVKAFNLAEMSQLTQSISKPQGILWLAAGLLFFTVAFLFFIEQDGWWIPGIFAIVLSQTLIILFWKDAKLGTMPNFIILLAVIIGFAFWSFNVQVNKEIKNVLAGNIMREQVVTKDMIKELPIPVQRWLNHSGVIGKEQIQTVYLRQKGLMKLKPDQKKWIDAEAEQYFTIDEPAFIWHVRTSMMGLPVVGRDLFNDGRGAMQIKLAGLIPVVNVDNNRKINESTIQRYLGETIWFPSAAISPYIQWEPIDDYRAKATMSIGEVTGSAVFDFNDMGELTKFVALRYRDTDDVEPTEWVATIKEYENVGGINIPTKLEASWILDEGAFTWYKFEIYDVKYNQDFK